MDKNKKALLIVLAVNLTGLVIISLLVRLLNAGVLPQEITARILTWIFLAEVTFNLPYGIQKTLESRGLYNEIGEAE